MHIGRARWESEGLSPSFFFDTFFFKLFRMPSSLEEIHFSDVRNVPSGKSMRHLVASLLPSLKFWLVSKIVRAVLAFRQMVSMNSRVTNRLQGTVPVTLLLFRPSESPFDFSVLVDCVGSSPHFEMSQQLSDWSEHVHG